MLYDFTPCHMTCDTTCHMTCDLSHPGIWPVKQGSVVLPMTLYHMKCTFMLKGFPCEGMRCHFNLSIYGQGLGSLHMVLVLNARHTYLKKHIAAHVLLWVLHWCSLLRFYPNSIFFSIHFFLREFKKTCIPSLS